VTHRPPSPDSDLPGDELPRLRTEVPGPRSRALSARLAHVESRNITRIAADGPIFWSAAAGANVCDVDGNIFVDLTAGFGVAHAGHTSPLVARAIAEQAHRLQHALGDVHPADVKLELLEQLARIAPGDLSVVILGSSGAEAVEAALKTAALHTGRPGVVAFERAYHGLTMGALAVTSRRDFRDPFVRQLFHGVRFAPFPSADRGEVDDDLACDRAVAGVVACIDELENAGTPAGAILVEPVQGRGGLRIPAAGFLRRLRELCDGRNRVLIFDEIYTGLGRTGRWFAADHAGVVPDIIAVGKALTGSLPLSAAVGSPAVMAAWPPSTGEAIHTSTFLGNPIACAAAIAQLTTIESNRLLARAAQLGETIQRRTLDWMHRFDHVRDARGIGLIQGVELKGDRALPVAAEALRQGILVLAEGEAAEVLAITPPAVITDAQLDFALDVLESAIAGQRQ
jgi:4-aminobutyrate aminotransferase-like enzyme